MSLAKRSTMPSSTARMAGKEGGLDGHHRAREHAGVAGAGCHDERSFNPDYRVLGTLASCAFI
jgi:hypothetical protein